MSCKRMERHAKVREEAQATVTPFISLLSDSGTKLPRTIPWVSPSLKCGFYVTVSSLIANCTRCRRQREVKHKVTIICFLEQTAQMLKNKIKQKMVVREELKQKIRI
jgi:hypothetical protein